LTSISAYPILQLQQRQAHSLSMNYSIPKTTGFCLHLICGFVLIALFAHHASAKEAPVKRQTPVRMGQPPLSDEEIQEAMKKYLGVRYKRAGASKKGFDCSGFVKIIYEKIFGVDLPHQSSQQCRSPELVSVSENALKTGDLIFFSTGRKKKSISHVGIYFSDGKFIHSARSKGVVISKLDNPYWLTRIVGTKRLAGRDWEEVAASGGSTLDMAMPLSEQSTLSFRHQQVELPGFSPVLFENGGSDTPRGGQLHSLEMDFAKILDHTFVSHFTVFRQDAFAVDQGMLPAYKPILGPLDQYQTFGAYAQGLKLSGDIRPTGSFFITPSISYLDYGPGVDSAALPKLTLGLNFDFFSPSDGWSLSTGLHMPIQRYASSLPLEETDNYPVGLSLTYRQQVSDHVQLSVTGDNFFSFPAGVKRSSFALDPEDQHFTVMLHFSY
jgi:NlpC/P60 family